VTKIPISRALISVHDKTGVDRLARVLHGAGIELVSTGQTAAAITAAGVPVTPVEQLTGMPEMLGGRVKTLHPAVHAGLLADPRDREHAADLSRQSIAPFQLLVSNLYPFAATVSAGADPDQCVAQIDIGGPAMIRAAAKNHAQVAVVTSPAAYAAIEDAVAAGGFTVQQRRRLAASAFAHTASYDAAVASWFASQYAPDQVAVHTGWPDLVITTWSRGEVLRYGENPHQRAALYTSAPWPAPDVTGQASAADGQARGVAAAERLHGKAMSYNNYVDADAAWRAVTNFAVPCVSIVKHANPCGIAIGGDIAQAHRKAHACDPASAYGAVVAANRVISSEMAGQLAGVFTEVVIAEGFEPAALEILTAKKNLRLLAMTAPAPSAVPAGRSTQWRQIGGGLLLQSADAMTEPGDDPAGWRLAAGPPACQDALADLAFAWQACRGVKSNAILIAAGQASVGIGMGQVNRVDAARLAVARAGGRAAGSVAASDAFFPFADGFTVLAEAGLRAVVEPGGSVRDEEVIAAAAAAGVSLYFTGVRHFWH
jgi:phosphoribosylaminoimidazolecarboxamide formyltransferase/IMP cyclohydrolase